MRPSTTIEPLVHEHAKQATSRPSSAPTGVVLSDAILLIVTSLVAACFGLYALRCPTRTKSCQSAVSLSISVVCCVPPGSRCRWCNAKCRLLGAACMFIHFCTVKPRLSVSCTRSSRLVLSPGIQHDLRSDNELLRIDRSSKKLD
jgi:hypothetical protein